MVMAVPLVKESSLVVQTIEHTLRMVARADNSQEEGCVRITAECYSKEGVFTVADYISDTLLAQSFDPFQSMMVLHKKACEQIAQRGKAAK